MVVEVAPPGAPTAPVTVRVESHQGAGPWFEWAVVGADDWGALAEAAGLCPSGFEVPGRRWFASALRPAA